MPLSHIAHPTGRPLRPFRRRAAAAAVVLIAVLGVSTPAALAGRAVLPASSRSTQGIITTVAGLGHTEGGYNGDHRQATTAKLDFPIDVAPVPANQGGGFLIADEGNERIRRVNANGVITTVAGTGARCSGIRPNRPDDPCGDTGKARAAVLNQPTGVAALPGGGFLIADRSDGVIRKVAPNGLISTVAGNGQACEPVAAVGCGDGGSALDASLDGPDRVALLPGGGFLITEDQGNRVPKVSAGGTITTVAGDAAGSACPDSSRACGDGGAATAARLNAPNGIAVLPGGGFVLTDSQDNRVRRVGPKGRITTIAGTGDAGSFGDHVPATQANLNSPSDVAVAPNGAIVIADTNSQLVRVVRGGEIHRIAGLPDRFGDCADGVPGRRCRLHLPFGVGMVGGDVLIADHFNHRIRRVDTNLVGS